MQMSFAVPMIVRVIGDGSTTDVPVTPDTTCSDVIECCRDPGDESCNLFAVSPELGECPLRGSDHPLEILQRWGSGRLVLKYTVLSADGGTYEKRNGMKEPEHFGETVSRRPFKKKNLAPVICVRAFIQCVQFAFHRNTRESSDIPSPVCLELDIFCLHQGRTLRA